jgi:hypothetical protein
VRVLRDYRVYRASKLGAEWHFCPAVRPNKPHHLVGDNAMSSLPDSFFRDLSPDQRLVYRKWARDNYIPGEPVKDVWHPVVRDECNHMNAERNCRSRFTDAYYIANGACNPVAVANTLMRHIDAMRKNGCDHPIICSDPGIRLIVHQLSHLCRCYAFDVGNSSDEYRTAYDAVEAVAKAK